MNLPRKRATPRRKAHPVKLLPEHRQRKRSPEEQVRREQRVEDRRDERMDFRARVWAASPGGLGDCHGTPWCRHTGPHRADDPHHLHPRGMGGGGGSNATSNGIPLCRLGHDGVHAHTAEAEALDLLRRRSDPWPKEPTR